MNHHDSYHPFQEAGMFHLLSDYYKYSNPELHIYYYQRHIESMQKALTDNGAIFSDTQRDIEYGKIRMLHASKDVPLVDIYINGVRIYKEVSYKMVTNDFTLPTGRYQIDVYETGDLIHTFCSQKIMVEANMYHTLAFSGPIEKLKIYSFIEDPYVPYNETKLRFVHLASNTSSIHISVQKGDIIFSNIHAKNSSSYLGLYPMTVYLEIKAAETNESIAVLPPLTLKENKSYSAILLDSQSSESLIEVLLLPVNN